MRVLFQLLALYLVYKLIFDFIIPIFQTTKQVKNKMGEMESRMNEHLKQQQFNSTSSASDFNTPKPSKEDYIEFEEVK